MDNIHDLLRYLPKGSFHLYFQQEEHGFLHQITRTLALSAQGSDWLECYGELPQNEDEFVCIHKGDSILIKGRRDDGAFITQIQNMTVPLTLDMLLSLLDLDKLEQLLTDIRQWVWVEGKSVVEKLPKEVLILEQGRYVISEAA